MEMAGGKGIRLLKLLALMADEVAVLLILVVILPSFGVHVPLWIAVVVISFLLLKDFLIAPYVLGGGLERKPSTGAEALVGRIAVVVEDLSPARKARRRALARRMHPRNGEEGGEGQSREG